MWNICAPIFTWIYGFKGLSGYCILSVQNALLDKRNHHSMFRLWHNHRQLAVMILLTGPLFRIYFTRLRFTYDSQQLLVTLHSTRGPHKSSKSLEAISELYASEVRYYARPIGGTVLSLVTRWLGAGRWGVHVVLQFPPKAFTYITHKNKQHTPKRGGESCDLRWEEGDSGPVFHGYWL